MEALFNYIDKFSKEILFIQIGFLLIVFAVFAWIWLYNRRRYQHLKHQIPASVVKNYLDSIIQNSTALKSSLFRGGGLELGEGVPSVLSFEDIAKGGSQAIYTSGNESEELNAKNAEIMRLRTEVDDKQIIIRELEKELASLKGELRASTEREQELNQALENKSPLESGPSPELEMRMSEVTKERDELKNRLAEYAVIEDELANIKKLKQENERLKNILDNRGITLPAQEQEQDLVQDSELEIDEAPELIDEASELVDDDLGINEDELLAMEEVLNAESASEEAPEAVLEEKEDADEVPSSEEVVASEVLSEDTKEAISEEATKEVSSEEETSEALSEKSPDDLLSEFEKMLS